MSVLARRAAAGAAPQPWSRSRDCDTLRWSASHSGRRESRARLTGLPRAAADSLRAWRGDKLRQFPELRFTYEEEAAPEDFFVPMVWALVVAHTASVPWNLQARARRCSPAPVTSGWHPQRSWGRLCWFLLRHPLMKGHFRIFWLFDGVSICLLGAFL